MFSSARMYRGDIELLNLLARYKPVSSKQLARMKRISKRAACYTLSKLERMGLLEGVGPHHSPFREYVLPGIRTKLAKGLFKQIVIALKRMGSKYWIKIPAFIRLKIITLQRLLKDVKRRIQTLENGSPSNPGMTGVRGTVCEPKGGRGI